MLAALRVPNLDAPLLQIDGVHGHRAPFPKHVYYLLVFWAWVRNQLDNVSGRDSNSYTLSPRSPIASVIFSA
jgi:hypothetical protein